MASYIRPPDILYVLMKGSFSFYFLNGIVIYFGCEDNIPSLPTQELD